MTTSSWTPIRFRRNGAGDCAAVCEKPGLSWEGASVGCAEEDRRGIRYTPRDLSILYDEMRWGERRDETKQYKYKLVSIIIYIYNIYCTT